MRIRKVVLVSTAATAIATAAFAQSAGYDVRYGGGPQSSTPTEMQQTNELNQQGINGTYQSPAALNGQQPAQNAPVTDQSPNATAPYQPQQMQYTQPPRQYTNAPVGDVPQQQQSYDSGQTQYSGPQAQYQSQQDQYQDQMQRYHEQQQDYRYDRARYRQNLRDYDLAQYAWSYPAPLAYHYGEGYGLQPLYLIAEPSRQLWQAPVEGSDGRWVGRVRNVDIGPDGRPFRVEVALNRRVSVWVSPGDLRFDPADGMLYTDLTRGELWSMPGATITSGPL